MRSHTSGQRRYLIAVTVIICGSISAPLALPLSTAEISGHHSPYDRAVVEDKLSTIQDFDSSSSPTDDNNNKKKYNLRSPSSQGRETSQKIHDYTILSQREIYRKQRHLAKTYSNFVTLTTTQQTYGLPTAGTENDCTWERNSDYDDGTTPDPSSSNRTPPTKGCQNYVLTIQDKKSHPPDSSSWKLLPEVYLSGALHGNERVGPTAVMHVAHLLLKAADCESKPQGVVSEEGELNDEKGAEWLREAEEGKMCRKELEKEGMDEASRRWLARLVSTRRIVVVPTANALGYARNERVENKIDPNRDFPFDLLDETKCMQTIAGRTTNELFRDHMFQMSLTFHGGMEIVSYEWGAPTYKGKLSPDDVAQKEIGAGYSKFAGGFKGTAKYQAGTMNEFVYPVRGGMEDWAYAGSWDPDRVIKCHPRTYGGYDPAKTVYNTSTLRAFNMLIEASDDKTPKDDQLGSSKEVFNDVAYESNGHITRNMRLSLMAIDLVEPYASLVGVNGIRLSNDIIPMTNMNDGSCKDNMVIRIPKGQKRTFIDWTVGGGFTVDYTTILHSRWNDLDDSVHQTCKLDEKDLSLSFNMEPAKHGRTHWHEDGAEPQPDGDMKFVATSGPAFSATIDTSQYKVGDRIAVFASVRLDQGWKEQPDDNISPRAPPMSHIVNARTNSDWRHESAGKIIQGRQMWYSMPLTLVISEERGTHSKEISDRFKVFDEEEEAEDDYYGDDDNDDDDDEEDYEEDDDDEEDYEEEEEEEAENPFEYANDAMILSALFTVLVVCFILYKSCYCLRRRRKYRGRVRLEDQEFVIDDEFEDEIQLREFD